MTISEIRRLNLRALIKEHGSAAALCQRVPRLANSYISQILHATPNQSGRPPSQAKHPRRRSTATIQTPGRPEQPTTLTCTPNTATALDGRSGLRLKKNIIFFTLKA